MDAALPQCFPHGGRDDDDDAVPQLSGLEQVVVRLRAAGCVFAEDEAALLLEAASPGPGLEGLVQRRVAGEPLEHVLGWAAFRGLRVPVLPGVFVPRLRTELLAEQAILAAAGGEVVVDLCCGCAPIALAVLQAHPGLEVHAADLDPAAVGNARVTLAGHPRAQVHHGDLFAALPPELVGRVDVLVSNVPYVPEAEIALMPAEARLHENRLALDGGPDGLAVARRVLAGAVGAESGPHWLAPGGRVLFETSRAQVPAALAAAGAVGLVAHVVTDDERGATVVRAELP